MSTNGDQCIALTGDGDRCSHTANDGAFCHQHDADDPTVDGAEPSEADDSSQQNGDSQTAEGEDRQQAEEETKDTVSDSETATNDDAQNSDGEKQTSSSGADDLLAVRDTVVTVATELIGPDLDSIIEIQRNEDGWLATFEVVERHGVPDTQDILGRYEMTLEDADNVSGYSRVARYRRSDTSQGDTLE